MKYAIQTILSLPVSLPIIILFQAGVLFIFLADLIDKYVATWWRKVIIKITFHKEPIK